MPTQNNFLGFHSVSDFLSSLLRFKDWSTNAIIGFVGATTTFINGYMWDTPSAIYTLWFLMFVDWVSGIIKSAKNKSFVSYKIFRMPIYFLATSIIISLSWWMAKGSIIFYLLPGFVLGGFYSVYFISLLENFGELNLLPKQLVQVLKSKFGLKVIVDKYFTDTENKSE